MSLGLGIFLSSLFLGIIFLFVSTKDRWNWKKILFIWPLCFVLIVGVVGGAARSRTQDEGEVRYSPVYVSVLLYWFLENPVPLPNSQFDQSPHFGVEVGHVAIMIFSVPGFEPGLPAPLSGEYHVLTQACLPAP